MSCISNPTSYSESLSSIYRRYHLFGSVLQTHWEPCGIVFDSRGNCWRSGGSEGGRPPTRSMQTRVKIQVDVNDYCVCLAERGPMRRGCGRRSVFRRKYQRDHLYAQRLDCSRGTVPDEIKNTSRTPSIMTIARRSLREDANDPSGARFRRQRVTLSKRLFARTTPPGSGA